MASTTTATATSSSEGSFDEAELQIYNTNSVDSQLPPEEAPKPPPAYIGMALGISSQDWETLGLGDDPTVAASSDLEDTVDRITALLLVRIVAWIQPRGTFSDLSATTICRHILINPDSWPSSTITPQVMDQLRQYVKVILQGYNQVPYHNFEHCYHVTISTNKLLDMMLDRSLLQQQQQRPTTYGLRDDPLMQFVLVFTALIHDVEHKGIPNRQLAMEDDILALQYNDQSIAEMRSLTIAFSEFLKPDYELLRSVVLPENEDYRRFRAATINLVLTTDLASPDRAQIGKSKWKEAFGDPYETVERKVLTQMARRASLISVGRKSVSRASRRMSAQSIMSELTFETPVQMVETQELNDDESVSVTPDSSDNEEEHNHNHSAYASTTPAVPIKRTPMPQASDGTGPVFRPPKTGSDDDVDMGRISPRVRTPPPAPVRSRSGDGLQAVYRSPHMSSTMRKLRAGKKGGSEPPFTGNNNNNNNMNANGGVDAGSVQSNASGNLAGMALKFHRRLSAIGTAGNPAPSAKRYRNTRLGLLRTVDLSGESLETYQKMQARVSATGASTDEVSVKTAPVEETDFLRESVVMETIIKAADVAHNLQGWEQMAKWSNRLFLELKRAYVQGRGEDPQGGWFSNQIGFLEAYLLPLARRLDDTGVFGDEKGAVFAQLVEENKERWMREGMSLTADIIREGHVQFPEAESDDELGSG